MKKETQIKGPFVISKAGHVVPQKQNKGAQTPIGTHFNESLKRKDGFTRKLSKDLSKRTKLNPDQLKRVQGQAGGGLASRYGEDGVQSLALTRRLQTAKKKARKFVLFSTQLGKDVYVGAKPELFPLTFDIKEARLFIEGFDDSRSKVDYWNLAIPALSWMVKHM